MSVKIKFLGASGTVTGSKYLIQYQNQRILVDCGMFQGDRSWREKNWDSPPIDLKTIDAVLITHAHIDHIGMLPRYGSLGLKCPIVVTPASLELCRLLLLDSGRLQEEEARYRSAHGSSRHNPPLPLYTERDVNNILPLFKKVHFNNRTEVLPGVYASWSRMGHIIGAAAIQLEVGGKLISFSGDVGRYDVPILIDPQPINFGDLLLIESTYGDRLHSGSSPEAELAEIITRTYKRNGIVVIPSFAVGRCQLLLFYIRKLKAKGLIPDIPVVIDSPMASDATSIYSNNPDDFDEGSKKIFSAGQSPFSFSKLYFTKDREESIKLNSVDHSMVLISASGMLTGGRILHHLKHRISDPRNTILFVGFQPPGSRGDWIKSGAKSLRIFGEDVQIRAEISELSMLSAHGDKSELLRWCKEGKGTPGRVAVVHGEPATAKSFADTLKNDLNWNTFVADYLQEIEI